MQGTVFLLIKVSVDTNFKNVRNAAKELQRDTDFTLTSTKNVAVLAAQIVDTKPTK